MNKQLNGHQVKVTELSRFCQHVAARRIDAPKRCLLNHECFHCGYDQWLDAIDFEKVPGSEITGASKCNLSDAA